MRTVIVSILLLISGISVSSQSDPNRAIQAELGAFYDSYAEDLRQSRREAIANRYDRRGSYFLGNGAKALETFEENKRYYLTKWTGPKSFAWKDLEFEIVSPKAVVVIGRFDWATEKEPKTQTCSYTGLVLKTTGEWRIRVEDESCPPPK